MTDRVPTPGKEGRVKIRLDDGSTIEGVLEMADDPLADGTPFRKSTMLTDQTADKLGLGSIDDPTVDDALNKLANGKESTFQKLMTGRLI